MSKKQELSFEYFLKAWIYYMKNTGFSYPIRKSWNEWILKPI